MNLEIPKGLNPFLCEAAVKSHCLGVIHDSRYSETTEPQRVQRAKTRMSGKLEDAPKINKKKRKKEEALWERSEGAGHCGSDVNCAPP